MAGWSVSYRAEKPRCVTEPSVRKIRIILWPDELTISGSVEPQRREEFRYNGGLWKSGPFIAYCFMQPVMKNPEIKYQKIKIKSYIDKVLAFCLSSSCSSHRAFQCEIGKSQGYTATDKSTNFPCAYPAMGIRVGIARRLDYSAWAAYISTTSIHASVVSHAETLSIVDSATSLENDIDFIGITRNHIWIAISTNCRQDFICKNQ